MAAVTFSGDSVVPSGIDTAWVTASWKQNRKKRADHYTIISDSHYNYTFRFFPFKNLKQPSQLQKLENHWFFQPLYTSRIKTKSRISKRIIVAGSNSDIPLCISAYKYSSTWHTILGSTQLPNTHGSTWIDRTSLKCVNTAVEVVLSQGHHICHDGNVLV